MTENIPYGRQDIRDEDVEAVAAVLRSDWLTQGPWVERFERAVAERCGAPHATAVNSATSALHLACRALELGPGDRLWTSPNTFVASANCARYCGADVDFVDIDPRTWNLSAAALAEKLARAAPRKALPKVVMPVHFAGQPCDLRPIRELSERYGFRVVEDASHAIGARYAGTPVGDCAHSDLAVFSFHPVKIITTGEGGLLTTRDPGLDRRLKLLRSHGITRDPARLQEPAEGGWYYEQTELGYNYRITDFQCALGASQLARLDGIVARRAALADRYDRLLAGLPLRLPHRAPQAASAWHLYVVCVDEAAGAPPRKAVYEALRARGIGVNVHYIPVHLQPYYRALGFKPGDFPEAERYYKEAITLPLFPTLDEARQDRVVAAVREALRAT